VCAPHVSSADDSNLAQSVIINTIALLEPRLSTPGYSGDSHTLYNVLSQNKAAYYFRCFQSTQTFPFRDLIQNLLIVFYMERFTLLNKRAVIVSNPLHHNLKLHSGHKK
jgi:hypothetical protein